MAPVALAAFGSRSRTGEHNRSPSRTRQATRTDPLACGQQGTLGRNVLNGFGATEVDLTLRRQFKLRERLSLQARADFFNIFNHPDFGPPTELHHLSALRPSHPDARLLARRRRPDPSTRYTRSAGRARRNWR